MPSRTIETPTGPFTVTQSEGFITAAGWGGDASDVDALIDEAESQIGEYFAGTRTSFDLPVRVLASDTQITICDAIAQIPFGETRTYGDLARALDMPAQAVGQGCGGNPIALIIPCHRVLGASSLGGFSAPDGIETKVELLRHEGAAGLLI